MSDQSKPVFRLHPSVVLQLGEALVSDGITAIVELVKNAYDADSPDASIIVDTKVVLGHGDSFFPGAEGRIVIEDSGCGMDWKTIERGWLTVSDSPKRQMKAEGRLTPGKGRTPLGDKGLGRLGVQRLGGNVEIFTCADGEDSGYHVGISWAGFRQAPDFTGVEILWERIPKRKGTRVVISDLRDADLWASPREKDELQRQLSQVFFPFGGDRAFAVRIYLDGQRLDLNEAIEKIRDTATIRFSVQFDGQSLSINGRYRLGYLRSQENKDAFSRYVEPDRGASLAAQLVGKLSGEAEYIADKPGWFIRCLATKRLDEMPNMRYVEGHPATPGPFTAEIDSFELIGGSLADAFSNRSEFRSFIKRQSGVRIYRDGFAVRPYGFPGQGHDWLGFAKAATSARSSYVLRLQSTVGFVSISARENQQLVEKTDREGFQETPYTINFFRLLEEVIAYVNNFNNQLRRGTNDFMADLATRDPNESMVAKMRGLAHSATDLAASASAMRSEVETLLHKTEGQEHPSQSMSAPTLKSEPTEADLLADIRSTLARAKELLRRIEQYASHAQDLSHEADRLEYHLNLMQEQVTDFTELASLGLVAEAFSHELRNVADGLEERTKQVQTLAGSRLNPAMLTYFGTVRQSLSAMRKQLAHLTPSLRYLREQREVIDIRHFVQQHISFYAERFKRKGISYLLEEGGISFRVRINRGKLLQVLDNLVLNSEYWLVEGVRKRFAQAQIHAVVAAPFIQIWDTGSGVDRLYENTLFQPFVTGKPPGEGRGLGLYIVRQLLEADGCYISLLPQRNDSGRRYIFQLDLSGVCTDGH